VYCYDKPWRPDLCEEGLHQENTLDDVIDLAKGKKVFFGKRPDLYRFHMRELEGLCGDHVRNIYDLDGNNKLCVTFNPGASCIKDITPDYIRFTHKRGDFAIDPENILTIAAAFVAAKVEEHQSRDATPAQRAVAIPTKYGLYYASRKASDDEIISCLREQEFKSLDPMR
jgi:hypothetical protein